MAAALRPARNLLQDPGVAIRITEGNELYASHVGDPADGNVPAGEGFANLADVRYDQVKTAEGSGWHFEIGQAGREED
jgi:hypothetical protein